MNELKSKLRPLTQSKIQLILLNIMILYINGVLNKELSCKMFELIFHTYYRENKESLYYNFKKIICYDISYSLGVFYSLCDYYKQTDAKGFTEVFELLSMETLILKVNSLRLSHSKVIDVYSDPKSNFQLRKQEIKKLLIKYLKQEVNTLIAVIKLNQQLYDLVLFNRFHNVLVQEETKDYKIFLEIRSELIEQINKESMLEYSLIFIR